MTKYLSKEDFILNEIRKHQKKLDDDIKIFELKGVMKLRDSTIERLQYEIDLLKLILSILLKEKQ